MSQAWVPARGAQALYQAARQALKGDDRSRFAWMRHPLRIVTTAAAATCLTWPLTSGLGVTAAVIGVAVGVLLGEVLGKSKLKAVAALGGIAVGLGLLLLLGYGATHLEFFAAAVGPAHALALAVFLRFGSLALFPVAAIRAAATRRPTLVVAELAVSVAAIAYLFASHRGGLVARPLWLGDWAWRAGYDPVVVLLIIGAGSFVLLAAILATEHGRRASAISLVALPALAVLVVSLFNVKNLPKPKLDSELDRPAQAEGEPPKNPLDGPKVDAGYGNKGDQERDGGGHGQGDKLDGGQGNQGQDAGEDGGQGQDAGDGQNQGQDAGLDGGSGQDKDKADGGSGQDKDKADGGEGQDKDKADGGEGQDGGQDKLDGGEGQDKDKADGGGQSKDKSDGGQDNNPPPPQEPPPLDELPPPDSPQQQAPMAVVLLGDDYTPPGQMYYLRQETWSQFAGARLVAPTRPDIDRDVPGEFPTDDVTVPDAPPAKGRKLVHAKVVMVVPHKKPFALETPVKMAPAANPDPKRFVRAYTFEALAQQASYAELLGRKVGNPAWSADVREYYTRPPADPRFAELAKSIVAKIDPKKRADPFIQALAVKLWMDQNLTYSTRHRHANVPDPAADFLFGDRIGYCTHFAHSAVFMWRTLGIPARIGMGYAINGEAREGSALMVRSGDGHAWPELYVEGLGWVVVDISAKKNLDPPAKPVDKEVQRKLGEMARQEPEEPLKEEKPGRLKAKSKTHWPWRTIFAALAAAAVLLLYGMKLWRRLAPRFAGAATVPRIGYRAALDMLSELGLAREHGETRESFARRVEETLPAFGKMTAMHIEDSFGDPARPLADRPECSKDQWKRDLRQLRGELGTIARGWRAWLGRLNPASFFASK